MHLSGTGMCPRRAKLHNAEADAGCHGAKTWTSGMTFREWGMDAWRRGPVSGRRRIDVRERGTDSRCLGAEARCLRAKTIPHGAESVPRLRVGIPGRDRLPPRLPADGPPFLGDRPRFSGIAPAFSGDRPSLLANRPPLAEDRGSFPAARRRWYPQNDCRRCAALYAGATALDATRANPGRELCGRETGCRRRRWPRASKSLSSASAPYSRRSSMRLLIVITYWPARGVRLHMFGDRIELYIPGNLIRPGDILCSSRNRLGSSSVAKSPALRVASFQTEGLVGCHGRTDG